MIELKSITDDEKRRYKKAVSDFIKFTDNNFENSRVIIYINQLKSEYSPRYARKLIIYVRSYLKFINHPLADHIELPKIPKQRKDVIKTDDVRALLNEASSLNRIISKSGHPYCSPPPPDEEERKGEVVRVIDFPERFGGFEGRKVRVNGSGGR